MFQRTTLQNTKHFHYIFLQNTHKRLQFSSFHYSNQTKSQTLTAQECPYLKTDSNQTSLQACKPFDEMPGPKRFPIIGNLFDLIKNVKTNAGPYFLSLAEQYGDLVRLKTFNKELVILSNPELMGDLYKKEEKRSTIQSSRKYKLEKGIPLAPIEMLYEEPWQETRQLFNIAMKPLFQEQITIPQLTQLNGEMISRLIRYLEPTQVEDKFRLTDSVNAISRYGFDAVMAVFLGVKMTDEITKTFPFEIADFVKYSVESLDIIIRLLTKPSLYQYFKTKEYRQMEYTYEKSFEYANYVLNRFKVNPSEKPRLYELLLERSKNESNPELLVQSVMNSFLQAAIDITMTMMSHVMYRLAHHPDYQEQLYQELKDVFGEPTLEEVTSENGLTVTPEQFKKLKLTKNFVEEVLRLNPFGFASSARVLNQDTEIGGYLIPKGTQVIALQRRACLSEEYVPRANEFIPERHEKNSPFAMKNSFVSSPFGVGLTLNRKCPGSRIATTELCMSIVNVVRHFTLSLDEKEFPEMSTDRSLLYIDMNKHPLLFSPRSHLKPYIQREKNLSP